VGAGLWRTTPDIDDSWARMSAIGFSQSGLSDFAAPGRWNDPDMLEVGNGHMSTEEYRTHFSLWCLLAAPLLAGNDIAHMSAATRSILLNREVIALDQDPGGKQATLFQRTGEQEIWVKPLADGTDAVGLFNRASEEATIYLPLAILGENGRPHARDLWKHKDLTLNGEAYITRVPAHGVVLLRIQPGT
jgi:alpha-galactosidase